MSKRLQPDFYFDSVFSISPSFLFDHGIKAVVLDIDNTLVPSNQKLPSEQAHLWISELKTNNISVLIASNNTKKRVSEFADPLDVPYISECLKPSKKPVVTAYSMFGVNPGEIAVIGDQVFTDMGSARNGGAMAILTKPINDTENAFVKLKRAAERPIIKDFVKNNKDKCFGKE